MSESTKSQFYKYSMRSVCAVGISYCARRIGLEILPPDNAMTIENLFMHLKMTYDGTIPTADEVLERISIISGFPAYTPGSAEAEDYYRSLEVNLTPTADVIDVFIDLTSLLNKNNPGSPNQFETDDLATIVFLENKGYTGAIDTDGPQTTGTINIWKLDAIYTTREIR